MEFLRELYEFFPTAVYTGKALVFISEESRVELTEHRRANFSSIGKEMPVLRVRIFKKALNGEFVPGHYEDFELHSVNELAAQVERYIQFAVGKDIREMTEP
jgi:hypothetical protein